MSLSSARKAKNNGAGGGRVVSYGVPSRAFSVRKMTVKIFRSLVDLLKVVTKKFFAAVVVFCSVSIFQLLTSLRLSLYY